MDVADVGVDLCLSYVIHDAERGAPLRRDHRGFVRPLRFGTVLRQSIYAR